MTTSFITPGHVRAFQAVTTQLYGQVTLASCLINGKGSRRADSPFLRTGARQSAGPALGRILEARTRSGSLTHGWDSGLWELAVSTVPDWFTQACWRRSCSPSSGRMSI